jgi:hypothetical protein
MALIPLASFTPAKSFFPTWKMGTARVSAARLNEILGEGEGNCWLGYMDINGEQVKVACWDWYGSSEDIKPTVSVWCDKAYCLLDWQKFLEG